MVLTGDLPKSTSSLLSPRPQARRRVISVVVSVAVGATVTLMTEAGVVSGPAAWALLAIILVVVPSARPLSRRLALNIAILLGVAPILWWPPWPFASGGRAGFVLGVLLAVVALLATWSRHTRHLLLPQPRLVDALPFAVAAGAAAVLSPYLRFRDGTAAVAMLVQGTGPDNVAHFDIFEMVRRTQIATWWAPPPGSESVFAYTTYPQQFHVLAVFGAELWGGSAVGSVDDEAGLYSLGTLFTLALVWSALIAALIALPALRRHSVLALPSAAAVSSVLVLGFGATILGYGFANFVLGVGATSLGMILAATSRPRTVVLAAVASTMVVAAHTWTLFAPLAAVALLVVLLRLPWSSWRRSPQSALPAILVVIGAGAASVYALVLALLTTASAGSVANALATSGAVPRNPVALTFALVLGLALLGAVLLRRVPRRRWLRDHGSSLGLVSVLLAVVVTVVASALILVQLRTVGGLDYYQHKFLDGVLLICVVVGIAGVATLISPSIRSSRRGKPLIAVGTSMVVILASGLPVAPHPAFREFLLPATAFRSALNQAATSNAVQTQNLIDAAATLATWPCERPIYFAGLPGDLDPDVASQWAMALSATWTLDSGEINSYLFSFRDQVDTGESDAEIIRGVLSDGDGRCLVVAPQVLSRLSVETLDRYGDRLFSWT